MVDIALASQRLQTGSSGGISPTLLTAAAAHTVAPQLNTNAANIKNSAMPVPDIIIDSTLAATATAAAQINQAAFNYSQREAQVLATNASISYSKFVRDSLEGYDNEGGEHQPGYLATTGLGAGSAYPNMQQSLKGKREELLSELNPMARQMAALRMSSSENTAIGAASRHRQTQLGKAEEEARYLQRQDVIAQISVNPASITTPDAVSGMTAKDEFFKDVVNIKAANASWADIISETNEKVYQDSGLEAAKEFNAKVSQTELLGFPAQLTRVNADLNRWEKNRIRDENSIRTQKRLEAERVTKKLYDETEREFIQRRFEGDNPSKQEIVDRLALDAIDPQFARVIQSDIYGDVTRKRADADYEKKQVQQASSTALISKVLVGRDATEIAAEYVRRGDEVDNLIDALSIPVGERTELDHLIVENSSMEMLTVGLVNNQMPSNERLNQMVQAGTIDENLALGYSDDNLKAPVEAMEKIRNKVNDVIAYNMLNDKNPTPELLANLVKGRFMTYQHARNIQSEIESEERRLPEVSVILEWEEKVKNGTANRGYEGDTNLTDPTRSMLRQMEADLQNPKFSTEYKEISDNIDAWLKQDMFDAGLYDKNTEIRINKANREARARLKTGESKDSILNDMEGRFNSVTLRLSDLNPLRSGVKPATTEQVIEQANLLKEKYKKGPMSEEEFNAERANINDYFRTLKAAGL